MARPIGSDGARTEAAIRKAAIDLISAKGFPAVTLRDIAEHVGIQASSLYRYYPSKNELLTSIVTAHLEELLSDWEAARPDVADVAAELEAFIEFHVLYHSAKPKEVFIANMELRSLAPVDRKTVVAMRKRYEAVLQSILQAGIDKGVFSAPDVRVATFAILAMLTGLTAWYQEGGRLSKQELINCYSQLVMSGLKVATT
jgi:AcrR family transcriptional regulator